MAPPVLVRQGRVGAAAAAAAAAAAVPGGGGAGGPAGGGGVVSLGLGLGLPGGVVGRAAAVHAAEELRAQLLVRSLLASAAGGGELELPRKLDELFFHVRRLHALGHVHTPDYRIASRALYLLMSSSSPHSPAAAPAGPPPSSPEPSPTPPDKAPPASPTQSTALKRPLSPDDASHSEQQLSPCQRQQQLQQQQQQQQQLPQQQQQQPQQQQALLQQEQVAQQVGGGGGGGGGGCGRQRLLLELGDRLLMITHDLDSTIGELKAVVSAKAVKRGLPPAAHLALRISEAAGDDGLAIMDDDDTLRELALPRDSRIGLIHEDVYEAYRKNLAAGSPARRTTP
eukprot:jgi/Chlat1/6992/Chrsp56S09113